MCDLKTSNMSANLANIAGLVVSAGLAVYAAKLILGAREKDESASDVTARQLRGFFFLILASALLSAIGALTSGQLTLADLIYSVRP